MRGFSGVGYGTSVQQPAPTVPSPAYGQSSIPPQNYGHQPVHTGASGIHIQYNPMDYSGFYSTQVPQ